MDDNTKADAVAAASILTTRRRFNPRLNPPSHPPRRPPPEILRSSPPSITRHPPPDKKISPPRLCQIRVQLSLLLPLRSYPDYTTRVNPLRRPPGLTRAVGTYCGRRGCSSRPSVVLVPALPGEVSCVCSCSRVVPPVLGVPRFALSRVLGCLSARSLAACRPPSRPFLSVRPLVFLLLPRVLLSLPPLPPSLGRPARSSSSGASSRSARPPPPGSSSPRPSSRAAVRPPGSVLTESTITHPPTTDSRNQTSPFRASDSLAFPRYSHCAIFPRCSPQRR